MNGLLGILYVDTSPRNYISEAHHMLGIYIVSTSKAHFVAFVRSTGCLYVFSEDGPRQRKLYYFLTI